MTSAQFIACRDDAAFFMSFDVLWTDPNRGSGQSTNSGAFPTGDTKSIDMSQYDLTVGASIVPRVHALAGGSHDGKTVVAYAANGQTATYNVTGTIFSFSVKLLQPE